MQNLLLTKLSFNRLEENDFTKSRLYLSTIGWKMNVTRRLNDKKDHCLKEINEMDYGLKEMNEMDYSLKKMNEIDYGLKEPNDTVTKAEVMWEWVMMSWWNMIVMKTITEQRDDRNPNLKSIVYFRHQWCWSSKAICIILAPTLSGNSD